MPYQLPRNLDKDVGGQSHDRGRVLYQILEGNMRMQWLVLYRRLCIDNCVKIPFQTFHVM